MPVYLRKVEITRTFYEFWKAVNEKDVQFVTNSDQHTPLYSIELGKPATITISPLRPLTETETLLLNREPHPDEDIQF